jgi:hypothetical protein
VVIFFIPNFFGKQHFLNFVISRYFLCGNLTKLLLESYQKILTLLFSIEIAKTGQKSCKKDKKKRHFFHVHKNNIAFVLKRCPVLRKTEHKMYFITGLTDGYKFVKCFHASVDLFLWWLPLQILQQNLLAVLEKLMFFFFVCSNLEEL